MLMTAFVHDGGEPCVAGEDLDGPVMPEDVEGLNGKPRTLRELLADVALHTEDICAVSEPVATIALHALHGVAAASTIEEARAWALAALTELGFYDTDDIAVEPSELAAGTYCNYIASDPGREAVDKVRNGSPGGGFWVDWPAARALPSTDAPSTGDALSVADQTKETT